MDSSGAVALASMPGHAAISYMQPALCWALLVVLGCSKPKLFFSRSLSGAVYLLFIVAVVEVSAIVGVAAIKGSWIRDIHNPYRALFEDDPYTIGALRASASVAKNGISISHNALGFRGHAPRTDRPGIRIVAIGGSTTYGVSVDDEHTWPAMLEAELGRSYEVLNLGVPAHATTEHLATAAFRLPELSPDIVLLHVGLNDLHIMHAPELRPDYSNIHAPMVAGNLSLCFEYDLPPVATLHLGIIALQKLGLSPPCRGFDSTRVAPEERSGSLDPRAAQYYRRNLASLISLTRRWSARTIVVPQILIPDRLADGSYQWWTPYLKQDALPQLLQEYNRISCEVSREEGVEFAASVEQAKWTTADFVDNSHLGPDGNHRLAGLLAAELRESLGPSAHRCRNAEAGF